MSESSVFIPHAEVSQSNASLNSANEASRIENVSDLDQGAPKLPYFHRTLSAEDQAILGKNAPKRIEIGADGLIVKSVDQAPRVAGSSAVKPVDNTVELIISDSKLSSASAWNAAQSWEERNATTSAIDILSRTLRTPGLLLDGEIADAAKGAGPAELAKIGITILNVDSVEGTASVTHSRGKARYMYDMSFTLHFKIEASSDNKQVIAAASDAAAKIYKGKLKVIETNNDQSAEDLDFQLEWSGTSPSGPLMQLVRKAMMGSVIRKTVKNAMSVFESAFKSM